MSLGQNLGCKIALREPPPNIPITYLSSGVFLINYERGWLAGFRFSPSTIWYCWWNKSCTTWDVQNPIYNGINYLSAGAGFLLPEVLQTSCYSKTHVTAVYQRWKKLPMETLQKKTGFTVVCLVFSNYHSTDHFSYVSSWDVCKVYLETVATRDSLPSSRDSTPQFASQKHTRV